MVHLFLILIEYCVKLSKQNYIGLAQFRIGWPRSKSLIINYVDPPVGWGSTYCFTDVGVHVTPITKGTPAQIFLGGMFFVPQGICFRFLL